jgi:hypothetical protein
MADHYKSRTDIEMRSGQYAAPRQDADTGVGVARVRTPVRYQRAGLPDADACTSGFEGLQYPVRPHVRERLFFGYNEVWGAFEGTSVVRRRMRDWIE